MTKPARFAAAARREFLAALRHMEHAPAAERLKRSVETAVRLLGAHPHMGRVEPALAPPHYRFWSVPGFPYLLVYRPDPLPPSIVRFVHTAQDLPAAFAVLREGLQG